jgi:hypothetical protein
MYSEEKSVANKNQGYNVTVGGLIIIAKDMERELLVRTERIYDDLLGV